MCSRAVSCVVNRSHCCDSRGSTGRVCPCIELSVSDVGRPLVSVREHAGLEGVGWDRFEAVEPCRVSELFIGPLVVQRTLSWPGRDCLILERIFLRAPFQILLIAFAADSLLLTLLTCWLALIAL